MVNEARIGGLLHHANIVDIIEFGQVGKHYYMAMEYVDGATLSDIVALCRKRGVLLPRFAIVDLAIQACRGLYYAHNLRDHGGNPLDLIHRDLKPSNIIVDREGAAMILDFGIAKAASNLFHTTATGMVKGTPRYMSPEQITGEAALTSASDVFSFGAVLYEVITGRVLFHAEAFPALIHKIVAGDIGADLDAAEAAFPACRPILEKALDTEPDKRYPDARTLADDLRVLGRDYPPEADMADVIGKLLPSVDRTEVREIEDSQALDMDSSVMDDDGDIDSSAYQAPTGQTPIPADPTSAGWEQFSAAFDSAEMVAAAEQYGTDITTQSFEDLATAEHAAAQIHGSAETVQLISGARPGVQQIPSPSAEPGEETEALLQAVEASRRRTRIVGVVLVVLLLALVGTAVVIFGPGRDVDETDTPDGDRIAAADVAAAEPASTVEAAPPVEETEVVPTEPATAGEPLTEEPIPEAATPEPITAAPEPVAPEPLTPAAVEPPPEPAAAGAPGTISIYTRPWSEIWVDGARVASSNRLKAYAVDGGTHTVRIACPALENREKTFTITVDGNDANLGCWDFDAMAPCDQ